MGQTRSKVGRIMAWEEREREGDRTVSIDCRKRPPNTKQAEERTCFSSNLPLASKILQHRIALSPNLSRMTASTRLRFIALPNMAQSTAHFACVDSPCCISNVSWVEIPHRSKPDRTSHVARM